MRFVVLLLALSVLLVPRLVSAQQLPQKDESIPIEPPLLIPPNTPDSADLEVGPITVETLQRQLETSRKSAAAGERLVRSGILSKVEAEERALRVLRLESQLADAQLALVLARGGDGRKEYPEGEIGRIQREAANLSLTDAKAAADAAKGKYEQTRLENAERNLQRQRKLYSQGSAVKSEVLQAEKKLAALKPDEASPTRLPSATARPQ